MNTRRVAGAVISHFRRPLTNQSLRSFGSSAAANDGHKTQVLSFLDDGCMDYCRGWAWQQVLLSGRLQGRRALKEAKSLQYRRVLKLAVEEGSDSQAPQDDDTILLLEHSPVYTLGRGASEEHLTFLNNDSDDCESIRTRLSRKYRGPDAARLSLDRRALEDEMLRRPTAKAAVDWLASRSNPVFAPNGVPIYRVDRGGEVTFHGPTQLVIYPLLDLKRDPYKADLHWYLRMVEEVVIQTLQHYNIDSVRDEINTGVWVGENKIAAVGVAASSWISSHGLALNVSPDLDFFDTSIILPCGIEGRGVTSMQKELCKAGIEPPSLKEVADVALKCIQDIFQIQIDKSAWP